MGLVEDGFGYDQVGLSRNNRQETERFMPRYAFDGWHTRMSSMDY